MKKILFWVIWSLGVSSLGAANVLKEAKAAIKSGSNLEAAEKKLLETAEAGNGKYNKADLYFTAALVNKKINEQENEKIYLKKAYDTTRFFNSIYNMFYRFQQCDSVEMLPDAKGRVKIRKRAKARDILLPYRRNLLNAGKFYMRKTNYKEAYRFLNLYLESVSYPMFAGDDFARTDTMYCRVAYWATLSAYHQNNASLTLKYMDDALKYPFQRFALMEYKARAHKELGDTAAWLQTLETGMECYPRHSYFFTNLMDYMNEKHEYEKALKFARRMVRFDEEEVLFRYAESVVLMNMGDYRECIAVSDSIIQLDSMYTDAYYNKGLSYYNLAVTKAATACTDIRDPKFKKDRREIMKLYEQARVPLETVRRLAPEDKKRWVPPLYAIYLKLSRGKDFAEMEKLLRSMKP